MLPSLVCKCCACSLHVSSPAQDTSSSHAHDMVWEHVEVRLCNCTAHHTVLTEEPVAPLPGL